ncbi:MAG: hypothetical protein M0Z36_03970 [Thermaerobacter sp.]|nr:hypothetical protein [Thermaerobacter sp.]
MAVEQKENKKGTPLPPADPALDHAVHLGPNFDRLLRLRPQDLLKSQANPKKT